MQVNICSVLLREGIRDTLVSFLRLVIILQIHLNLATIPAFLHLLNSLPLFTSPTDIHITAKLKTFINYSLS